MTPEEWRLALAPEVHWKTAYAIVEREARTFLAGKPGLTFSTAALVDGVFPEGPVGFEPRRRLFRALGQMAGREMKDCVHKGEAVKRRFGVIRPNLWSAPGRTGTQMQTGNPPAAQRCPTCGHSI